MSMKAASPRIFLCGPISNALGDGGFDPTIRHILESIAQRLEEAGFLVLSAHRQEAYGDRIPEAPEEVFRRDWHLAQFSSAMVVVLPSDYQGRLFRTDGTFMELGWAVALGKPLFIVTDTRATGRSYLFDGLLRLSGCACLFEIEEALKGKMLAEALRQAMSRKLSLETENQVAFCCTSFGFGPVSKVVAVAEAVRLLRPGYRLVFIGSNIAERYSRSSAVFDDIVVADVDTEPEQCVSYAQDSDALVNALSFDVLSKWSRQMPPHFFLDSLAWMWPAIPDSAPLARTYFVQDYLLGANASGALFPSNAVLVPPILSPEIRAPRAEWESQSGYLLVNLAGCRNPILPPQYSEKYVVEMLTGLANALQLIDKGRLRPISRVVVCGNGDLLDAAEHVDWAGLSFPVERRFIPPKEFLLELRRCELFLTSPGLTATLEALSLNVPTCFLLPQNYSQFRIMNHYRSLGLNRVLWRDSFTSARLCDPLVSEDEAVREVGRLLQEQLDKDVSEISQAFQDLILLEDARQGNALLKRRIISWDGSIKVAQHIVRELEAGAELPSCI